MINTQKKRVIAFLTAILMVFQLFPFGEFSVNKAEAAGPDYIVNVPDPNLHEQLAILAGFILAGKSLTDDIYKSDFDKMVTTSGGWISISNNVADLTGLEGFSDTNIKSLDVPAVNLAPLANLNNVPNLKSFGIGNGNLTDLTPISHLTSLTSLNASYNKISDLTPIAGLTNLEELSLFNNKIGDITPLASLSNLKRLEISNASSNSNNHVTDITPLAGLANLEDLQLGDNGITDFSPLTNLNNLKVLRIGGNGYNQTRDLSFLAGKSQMLILDLGNLGLQDGDFGILGTLATLRDLNLGGNPISDLTPLQPLPALETLQINHTHVTDITPLEVINSLQRVDMFTNFINIWSGPNKATLDNMGVSGVHTAQHKLQFEDPQFSKNEITSLTVEVGVASGKCRFTTLRKLQY